MSFVRPIIPDFPRYRIHLSFYLLMQMPLLILLIFHPSVGEAAKVISSTSTYQDSAEAQYQQVVAYYSRLEKEPALGKKREAWLKGIHELQRIAKKYPKDRILPACLYLTARMYQRMHQRFRKNTDLSQAVFLFRNVLSRFSRHEKADDSLYAIAKIEQAKGNLKNAARIYYQLIRSYPSGSRKAEAEEQLDRLKLIVKSRAALKVQSKVQPQRPSPPAESQSLRPAKKKKQAAVVPKQKVIPPDKPKTVATQMVNLAQKEVKYIYTKAGGGSSLSSESVREKTARSGVSVSQSVPAALQQQKIIVTPPLRKASSSSWQLKMKAVQQKAPAPKGMSSQPPKILLAEEKIMRSKPVLRKKKTEPVTRSLLKAQTAHSEQTAEPMKITLPTKAELATESPANRQVKPIKTGQATASVKITALKPKNTYPESGPQKKSEPVKIILPKLKIVEEKQAKSMKEKASQPSNTAYAYQAEFSSLRSRPLQVTSSSSQPAQDTEKEQAAPLKVVSVKPVREENKKIVQTGTTLYSIEKIKKQQPYRKEVVAEKKISRGSEKVAANKSPEKIILPEKQAARDISPAESVQKGAKLKIVDILPIQHWSSDTYSRVAVNTSGPVSYQFKMPAENGANPGSLYIDFKQSRLASGYRSSIPVKNGPLKRIRAEYLDATTVRMSLDLEAAADCEIFSLKDPFRVVADIRNISDDSTKANDGKSVTQKDKRQSGTKKYITLKTEDKKKEELVIVPQIDHGKRGNMTVSAESGQNKTEKTLQTGIAPHSIKKIEEQPYRKEIVAGKKINVEPEEGAVKQYPEKAALSETQTKQAAITPVKSKKGPRVATKVKDVKKTVNQVKTFSVKPIKREEKNKIKIVEILPVQHWSSDNYSRVAFNTSGPVDYRVKPSGKKGIYFKILYIDLKQSRLSSRYRSPVSVENGLLKRIRAEQLDATTVRMSLDLESTADCKIFSLKDPFRIVVDVRGTSDDIGEKAEVAAAVIDKKIKKQEDKNKKESTFYTVAKEEKETGTLTLAQQLGLGVRRIVIDPGHGGRDSGATGFGLEEKRIVLKVAKKIKKILVQEYNYEVFLTRETDKFLPLEKRIAIANAKDADLFLSVHVNAHTKKSVRGVETFYLNLATNPEAMRVAARENATSTHSISEMQHILSDLMLNTKIDESSRFADFIQTGMVEGLRQHKYQVKNLGVKQAPFYVLIGAEMPAVLAEISFITNPKEAGLLKEEKYLQVIAEQIASGVISYIDHRRSAALD